MAEVQQPEATGTPLGDATYEIIRQRLRTQAEGLREKMAALDGRRKEVFGTVGYQLLQSDRIVTAHNCIPQDMIQLGNGRFLFGFNVQFGLKREMGLGDVFAVYDRDEVGGAWKEGDLQVLQHKVFLDDFKRLYNVYEKTSFQKFSVIDCKLYMVFSTGPGVNDLAAFKWDFNDGNLQYLDGRADSEFKRVGFPVPFDFQWKIPDRESFRYGDHPHISIEERVFIDCIGGDLTIKVEDNTATGEGIYSEPVDDRHQKVDDAEITYALVDSLILLKIRPYKETVPRFFIFNQKQRSVVRVDTLGQSCVLLPEDHGVVFPDGYYLASGELKRFEGRTEGLVIERVVHALNGEDSLYVFYDRLSGEYALLPYRLITQRVEERITCKGFSLFPNGQLVLFHSEPEPQKHHMLQLRQTPFCQAGFEPAGQKEAFLYQVGNKAVVRCLAECQELLTLIRKDQPYAELYTDLVKQCGGLLDSYPWLGSSEGFGVDEALRQVREAADKAVSEFDKVRRLQREASERAGEARKRCAERFDTIRRTGFKALDDYVQNLAELRRLRGELIALKDVRYVDPKLIQEQEQGVIAQTQELSAACVKFLLQPEALEPYRKKAGEHLATVEKVTKAAEGRELEKAILTAGGELELLIEVVNGLKIEDATETTRIIDSITAVYSTLNQVKASLKKRLEQLVATEGAAQFGAQLKLLGQAASSYLDLCDSPAKCDEYLNRVSVQLEEMEGTFAGFGDYALQLADRRAELYEAFEQRKIALVEERNRRAQALMGAAERILKVIKNRLSACEKVEDIHAYMASDSMIAKVRETIEQLLKLEDPVKADDLQGRLKGAHQEAVRQLKDRQDLFAGGKDVIQLGKHAFNVNTQPLDLTVVQRDGVQYLHLASTKYFDAITDEAFNATREVWDQEVVSENRSVYRAEYLAWRMLQEAPAGTQTDEERLVRVQSFMEGRYQEGYTKGVHDHDAALILKTLQMVHEQLQLARYHPTARACAAAYWHRFCAPEAKALWQARLAGFAERNKLFPGDAIQQGYLTALQDALKAFVAESRLFPVEQALNAGDYLFRERVTGEDFVCSREADQLVAAFHQHLVAKGREATFRDARKSLAAHPASELELVRDWVRGFLLDRPDQALYLDEVAVIVFCGDNFPRRVVQAETRHRLEGLKGSHPRIEGVAYTFDYLDFAQRLQDFEREVVPRYQRYLQLKQQLLERERAKLRLDELMPKVLSSFVRNQLIDKVYLPLIGDNLAKQIGAAGDKKRTDLMGLLLVVSPPGYGKTTLLEYIAKRLGIVFVKINGPALGQGVTSLDPEEAPNAAAREEVNKLNLALEMGDNTMICVDDIQHTNPEFLQKFISLCDGQRKIEGVWRGKPRTYDLRGRKVVVVMAGNPYTESGTKFRIPDMLANRADTYNLGDIIGGNDEWFRASYLENAVTSNAILAPLANRSQKDVHAFIRMAESGAKETFEGSYSSQEAAEILAVMKRLVEIQKVILRVNQEYIRSAAQADEFRVEPAFKLQGSYRNMNRLAEKVVPIMNDQEIQALILDHYRNESQTLTNGAEANFLKFKELTGLLTPEEGQRWEEIQKTFKRNQLVRSGDASDPVGRVVAQLSAFQAGLESIREALEARAAEAPAPPVNVDFSPLARSFETLRQDLGRVLTEARPGAVEPPRVAKDLETLRGTLAILEDMTTRQHDHLLGIQDLLANRAKQGVVEVGLTQEMLTSQRAFLDQFRKVLAECQPKRRVPADPKPPRKIP